MRRWAAMLAMLLIVGVTAVQAAPRSPASLMPAQVILYEELNLAQWHGGGQGPASLDQVFEQSGLLPGQRAVAGEIPLPGPVDSLKNTLSMMWEALQFVGPRIGWTMVPTAGGSPTYLGVAEVKDAAALLDAVHRIMRDNQFAYQEVTWGGDVKVLSINDGPAVAIAPDWAAFYNPPEMLDMIAQLAASGGEGSLAADPRYQRATKGLPQETLLTLYASPIAFDLMNDLVTSDSRPAPGTPLPAWPEDGIAWAVRASLQPQEGQPMLSLTWTINAKAASSVTAAALFGLMSPVFDRARESARKMQCASNVELLTQAMQKYLAEHGRFPKADRWTKELRAYVTDADVFRCADDRSGAECSYAMNWAFSGKPKSAVKDPARQILIYETAHPGPCPRGGKADMASPRHLGGSNFGFADGHVKWAPEQATQDPVVSW